MLPTARADYPSAARAYIFGKSRFGTGHLAVPVENDGDFHGNAALGAVIGERPDVWRGHRSSQTRSDAREILNIAVAAILHAIQGAIGYTEQFFRGVAVFRVAGHAGAGGKRGSFLFG